MMKVVCAVLLLGLSVIASAQSPDFVGLSLIASAQSPNAQQTPAQPPAQQQTNAPSPTPPPASTQVQKARPFYRFELSGGWSHITGDEGLNGFNAGAWVYLDPRISIGFNYDGVYDTTVLGAFALTNVGLTTTKSHLQNFMAGPRFYFPGVFAPHCGVKGHLPLLHPFVEAQFGESELWTEVSSVNVGSVTASDTAFSWLLGAGGDFDFKEHWSARINADLLRTHFVDMGQSRLRLILGVAFRW
jgi:hypothetical protein